MRFLHKLCDGLALPSPSPPPLSAFFGSFPFTSPPLPRLLPPPRLLDLPLDRLLPRFFKLFGDFFGDVGTCFRGELVDFLWLSRGTCPCACRDVSRIHSFEETSRPRERDLLGIFTLLLLTLVPTVID